MVFSESHSRNSVGNVSNIGNASDTNSNSNKKLKVYLTNAMSLRNKFKELESLVTLHDFDIVCVTESWVSEKFNKDILSEYELQGYSGYFYERDNRQGGGVVLYVKSSFSIRNVHNVKEIGTDVESVWLDIGTVTDNLWLRVGLFYRSPCPPNGQGRDYVSFLNEKYVDEINRALGTLGNDSIALVLGDFNYPDIDWGLQHASDDISKKFLDCVHDNFLEQMVHFPTRGGNYLDLVLTNRNSIISNMHSLARLGSSDHESVSFDLDINVHSSSNNKETYNYRKGDYDKFRLLLSEIDWDSKFRDKSCTEMWETFKSDVDRLQKDCIPKVATRIGNYKYKPGWWDSEIGNLIKEKHRANDKMIRNNYQVTDVNNFRYIRDKVKTTIRQKCIQEDIGLGREKNPKKLFRKYKVKSKVKERINFIKRGDQVFSGDKDISDGFNAFFASVFGIDNSDVDINLHDDEIFGNVNSLTSFEITTDSVGKIIRSLDTNKSMGPDGISARILKEGVDSLSYALTKIFNKSLADSVVPDDWKLANVVPIHKKGNRELVENYRPISLTSVVCRIMEKVVKYELTGFLNSYKLIRKSQHGFTKNRSCLTNLLEYLEYVTSIVDSGDAADVVYLDFSKAFDKVSHRKLIRKLWSFGIRGSLLGWISNWLLGRRQRVVLNGEESEWADVTSGVPQGSVLGPLLFILYANDLELGIDCRVYKFADDTKMVVRLKKENIVSKNYVDNRFGQKNVDKLVGWSDRWDMQFNASKCKVLHLGSNNPKFGYSMSGVWLEPSNVEKDLGIFIDDKLKFSKQVLEARNKANRMLGFISRNVAHRSKEVIKTLYNAYVRPHLEYCVQAWSPHYKNDIEMLEKVQHRATKLVSGLRGVDKYTRLRELNMFTLETRYKRGDMIEVYKIFNKLDDLNFEDFFVLNNDGLRGHSKKLKVKRLEKELNCRKYSFGIRIVELWNKLSEDTVSSNSLDTFKKLLDRDMFNLGFR